MKVKTTHHNELEDLLNILHGKWKVEGNNNIFTFEEFDFDKKDLYFNFRNPYGDGFFISSLVSVQDKNYKIRTRYFNNDDNRFDEDLIIKIINGTNIIFSVKSGAKYIDTYFKKDISAILNIINNLLLD